ncbi:MAG: HDOD domain-containing protein [Planctomycetes bacterium]|nr:HDOD domain-containing protein [Planctomycetota bacterium]MCB9909861.1 HDOD domain-containing protein [Planctomycetota bacterium]HPF15672.1 HDOD domain-containing protein [Planctomycetota bacterium]HRV80662.1 HDOD domain-containing protein [Planctomycetota bacterium]
MVWSPFGKSKAQKELAKILRGQQIPSFPGIVHKVLELLRDPDVDFDEIVSQLQWDPHLTVQLLKTVNSAAYGLAHPISDVKHAVGFLGRASLEQIVLGLAVRNLLPHGDAPGFDAARYWRTASYRAALARGIAHDLHPAKEAECFTAALLQDLAIPVLVHALPGPYGAVLGRWHGSPEGTLQEMERKALGWSHDEVGGLICEHWDLPEDLARGIATHHTDAEDRLLPALKLVAIIPETEATWTDARLVRTGLAEYGIAEEAMLAHIQTAKSQAHKLSRSLAA